MKRSIGICLGASTISMVERHSKGVAVCRTPHGGDAETVVREMLAPLLPATVGFTGRKLRSLLTVPTVSEPEAIELAWEECRSAYGDVDCIVSAGGETFLVYLLDRKGRVKDVLAGNKCASGTGEFFLQQLRRIELPLEEALRLASQAEPYQVAGRCSVFCKSDCTHALNKGAEKGAVVAGLCQMMAGKIVELLKKGHAQRVALVGGVSQNRVVVDLVKKAYPHTVVPVEAGYFEALGALAWGERQGIAISACEGLFRASAAPFPLLPEIRSGLDLVEFKSLPQQQSPDGECLLGLDVGSTTTKAVLVRRDTLGIVASVYLRTNGNPIRASRECYASLRASVGEECRLLITGLAVTGSGRQIAGLHARTRGVINEIVAHAAAAVYFDPEVETIFEIGGQDAKYTFIVNGVASDYAMNEACSAGTGSFLEEAAKESLGMATEDIAGVALGAGPAPDFNDQCAAFIGSDIKTAAHNGVKRAEIAAGVVYSVCHNYLNRVKGNRPVGRKIFMQGGVCYNNAVPAAMANLCGQRIIVPPEPGLMGAYGAALVIDGKLKRGLLPPERFDLDELARREVSYGAPFTCAGGAEGCDRKCTITRIVMDGATYPFGGACERYANLRLPGAVSGSGVDWVRVREDLVFRKYAPQEIADARLTVGLPASLFANTFFPLYAHFFAALGIRTVRGEVPDPEGMEAVGAPFCHPVVLAHGMVKGLLERGVDYVFLPHIRDASLEKTSGASCTCPFVQGEPYYQKATFYDDLTPRLLAPILDFKDVDGLRRAFTDVAQRVGYSAQRGEAAFAAGWQALLALQGEMRELGRAFLATLEPDETALVLFGRPYNAFSARVNLGIPHKFASRGFKIIPHDFLPADGCDGGDHMYWSSGRSILRGVHALLRHPNLFGVYITSFSCGPDSFLVGQFRGLMGRRPSLTLELDAHTADAGVDTRIEAFLDIVRGYRELALAEAPPRPFFPARLENRGRRRVIVLGNGEEYPLTDPRVHMLIPSMGEISSEALAAAFRYVGVRADALPPVGREDLAVGKGEGSCKECLPLLLTTGSLLRYVRERMDPGEVVVYLSGDASGPCRFGQYRVFIDNLIRNERIDNVVQLTLSFENGYAGMPVAFTRRAWETFAIADGLADIRAAILALAEDRERALPAFDLARERIVASIAADSRSGLLKVLAREMGTLSLLPRKYPLEEAVKVSVTGEIYVRREAFARQFIVERLAEKGIVAMTAPVLEWLHYSDYCVAHALTTTPGFAERCALRLKAHFKGKDERAIRECLALSGFYLPLVSDVEYLMEKGARLVSPRFNGEAILTVAGTLSDVGDACHGVISIGPFGCMPCRVAQAIIGNRLGAEKEYFSRGHGEFWRTHKGELPLPFLAIESDGNPFPQVVEARIESFALAAHRLRDALREVERGAARGGVLVAAPSGEKRAAAAPADEGGGRGRKPLVEVGT